MPRITSTPDPASPHDALVGWIHEGAGGATVGLRELLRVLQGPNNAPPEQEPKTRGQLGPRAVSATAFRRESIKAFVAGDGGSAMHT